MRYTICIFAFFGLVTTACAANPFAGTWTFKAASSMNTGKAPLPKEETLVVEEQGDQLKVSLKGTAANGAAISNVFTVPVAGGKATVQEGPFEAISGKFLSPNAAELSYMIGGKEVSVQHSLVSGDGKTLYLVTRGTNAQGVFGATVFAFERQ